jgi:hypothetical protein
MQYIIYLTALKSPVFTHYFSITLCLGIVLNENGYNILVVEAESSTQQKPKLAPGYDI